MHTKKVDDLKINRKYFEFIFKIEFGIRDIKEKIVDKQSAEKPINEVIYSLFSIDHFFLTLFLLTQACNFHHVLHKLLRQ